MDEAQRDPDEAELHAYVDARLDAAAAARVAVWLQRHPEEAARVNAWQMQRVQLQALHRGVLDEPVPPALNQALSQASRVTTASSWTQALSQTLSQPLSRRLAQSLPTAVSQSLADNFPQVFASPGRAADASPPSWRAMQALALCVALAIGFCAGWWWRGHSGPGMEAPPARGSTPTAPARVPDARQSQPELPLQPDAGK